MKIKQWLILAGTIIAISLVILLFSYPGERSYNKLPKPVMLWGYNQDYIYVKDFHGNIHALPRLSANGDEGIGEAIFKSYSVGDTVR